MFLFFKIHLQYLDHIFYFIQKNIYISSPERSADISSRDLKIKWSISFQRNSSGSWKISGTMVWNIFHWCHDNSNFIFYVKVLIRHYRDKLTITPIKMIVGSSLFTFSLTTSCSSSSHKTSNSHNHTPFEFWNQALQSTRQLRKIRGGGQRGAITCQQQILLMQEKAFSWSSINCIISYESFHRFW